MYYVMLENMSSVSSRLAEASKNHTFEITKAVGTSLDDKFSELGVPNEIVTRCTQNAQVLRSCPVFLKRPKLTNDRHVNWCNVSQRSRPCPNYISSTRTGTSSQNNQPSLLAAFFTKQGFRITRPPFANLGPGLLFLFPLKSSESALHRSSRRTSGIVATFFAIPSRRFHS